MDRQQKTPARIESLQLKSKERRGRRDGDELNRLLSDDSLLHNLRSSTPFILFKHLNFLHSSRALLFFSLFSFSFSIYEIIRPHYAEPTQFRTIYFDLLS